MIGVFIHDDNPCVLLPLISNGDLRNYLQAHRNVSCITEISPGLRKGMSCYRACIMGERSGFDAPCNRPNVPLPQNIKNKMA